MNGKKKNILKNKYNNIFFIKIYHLKILIIFSILISFRLENVNNYCCSNYSNYYCKSLKRKIKIGIVTNSLKSGGVERSTSLILHYFNKVKIFKLFLFSLYGKQKNEYAIDSNIKRIIFENKNLTKLIEQRKLDILLYQFYNFNEINELKKIKQLKLVVINRSCFLHWIYYNKYHFFNTYYKAYKDNEYTISLIPFENDYLFKKWGINSILIYNFVQYEYNDIIPSDLSSDIILMIGRGDDRTKRFDLGIKSMMYIINKVPQSEMKIISNTNDILFLHKLTKDLILENYVKFVGYTSNPSIYYKNASIHIFPTLVESFGNVLTETKIFGIPNILVGLDYVSASEGGTVIIYDDSPIYLAKIAIKILKNKKYKKELGLSARNSMKKFNNTLILKRWIEIILSIYNGKESYQKLRNKDKKMKDKDAIKLISNQLNLLKYRNKKFINLTLKNVINLTFMENLK